MARKDRCECGRFKKTTSKCCYICHAKQGVQKSLPEHFWKRVDRKAPDECWEWLRYKDQNGRGVTVWNGRTQGVCRIAWQITYGAIPEGLWVCHKCDNRSCVNPAHLYLGTPRQNNKDTYARGRKQAARCFGEHNGQSKLTAPQVREIRKRYNLGGVTYKDLAREFGVHHTTLGLLIKRKTWAHLK